MFFDEITLKRAGWYTKLLYFSFPRAPKYNNFCPFFWLTIAATIVAPFKALLLGLGFLLALFLVLMEKMAEQLDNLIYTPYEVNKVQTYSVEELAKARWMYENSWYERDFLPVCEQKRLKKIWRWFKDIGAKKAKVDPYQFVQGKDDVINAWIGSCRKACVARAERERERERATQAKAAARVKFYTNLVKWTKDVVPILLIPICIFIGYHLFFAIGWCLYWVWRAIEGIVANWLVIVVWLGIMFGGGAIVVVLVAGLSKLRDSSAISFFFCKLGKRIGKFFSAIGRGIRAPFHFFYLYFKTFKENNCPTIKWED